MYTTTLRHTSTVSVYFEFRVWVFGEECLTSQWVFTYSDCLHTVTVSVYIQWLWVFTYSECLYTVSVCSEGWYSRSSWLSDIQTNNKRYGSEGSVMVSRDMHAIGGNGVRVGRLCLSHYRNIWSHVLEYLWLLLSWPDTCSVRQYGDETFSNMNIKY